MALVRCFLFPAQPPPYKELASLEFGVEVLGLRYSSVSPPRPRDGRQSHRELPNQGSQNARIIHREQGLFR